jgi:hypothetical protein
MGLLACWRLEFFRRALSKFFPVGEDPSGMEGEVKVRLCRAYLGALLLVAARAAQASGDDPSLMGPELWGG